jgi:uncharacterized protein YndB with AHSA1/START domain
MCRTSLITLCAIGILATPAIAQERQVRVAVTVPARVEQVWALWTTNEGVRSFFAPGSNIDLRVDGMYEIFFDPSAPTGQKGADGMRLLVVEPNHRLAFTWNAPREMAHVRAQRTLVTVDMIPVHNDSTRVVLRHTGWGTGPEWDAALEHFDVAWNAYVLPWFKYRVTNGPINWSAPPNVTPIMATSSIQYLATHDK